MKRQMCKLAVLSPSFVLTSAYAITGILPQLKAGLGLSQSQAEYIVTIPSIVVLIMVVISPWLQRWLHRSDKQMIIAGLAITGLAGMAPLIFTQYPAIVLARAILGLGIGLYNAQAISIIADWYQGPELSTMLGWHAAAEELGQATTVSLASILMITSTWHSSFWNYALAWIVLIFFARRVPNDHLTTSSHQADYHASLAHLDFRVFCLMLMAFLILTAYVGMENRFAALAVYLRGASYTGAGKFLSLMLVGSTLGGLTYGWFVDHLGQKTVYFALTLLATANLLFAFGANHFTLVALAIVMQGFPLQLISPWMFNQLSQWVHPDHLSIANSIVLVGFNLGAFISPSVTMAFNQLLGQQPTGIGLASPFFIYGGIIILMMVIISLVHHLVKIG